MIETRTRLLDIGEEAVRSRGFAGFSYADLARDVGIRKASIHHHFPTKADLGLALTQRYAENLAATLDAIREGSGTAGEALRKAIGVYRASTEGGRSLCLCVALATDTALLSEEVRVALEAANQATVQWFQRALETAQSDGSVTGVTDPAEEAHAILALLQGAQLLAKAAASTTAFDCAVASLEARING